MNIIAMLLFVMLCCFTSNIEAKKKVVLKNPDPIQLAGEQSLEQIEMAVQCSIREKGWEEKSNKLSDPGNLPIFN